MTAAPARHAAGAAGAAPRPPRPTPAADARSGGHADAGAGDHAAGTGRAPARPPTGGATPRRHPGRRLAVRLVERRIGLLFALFLALLVLAAVRAAWLGDASRPASCRTRARSQQVEDLDVPARRGTITDRNGVELAVSEDAVDGLRQPVPDRRPGRGRGAARAAARQCPGGAAGEAGRHDTGFVYLARKLDPARGEGSSKLEHRGHRHVVRAAPHLSAAARWPRSCSARWAPTARACPASSTREDDAARRRTASGALVNDASASRSASSRPSAPSPARTCG